MIHTDGIPTYAMVDKSVFPKPPSEASYVIDVARLLTGLHVHMADYRFEDGCGHVIDAVLSLAEAEDLYERLGHALYETSE